MLAPLERSGITFTVNRMPIAKRAQTLDLLVEGMSLRAARALPGFATAQQRVQ